jgi:hypothetical protein
VGYYAQFYVDSRPWKVSLVNPRLVPSAAQHPGSAGETRVALPFGLTPCLTD